MKTEPKFSASKDRRKIISCYGTVTVTAMAGICLTLAAAQAAAPTGSGPAGKNQAVTFEVIPGGHAKRIILTAKAAERLGIKTGRVGMKPIILKQMVSGVVVPPLDELPTPPVAAGGFGGFMNVTASAPAAQAVAASAPSSASRPGEAWLLVTLSPGEWEKLAKDKPVRVLPLSTRDTLPGEVLAHPSGISPVEDMKRSMLTLYYVLPGRNHGLTHHSRMRVELQLEGTDENQKVVPYSAVYYDAKGVPWVYLNPKPLTYERRRITIDRVVGDLAVLTEGPAVGTPVVTVGVALLYGTEVFGK